MHPSSPEFQSLSPFQQLVEVVAALRAPDGCPWDRQQTHQTLTPFMIEEAYECVEALELDDDPKMVEELGDLAFQVVLHAQLARERGAFDVEDVCRGIVAKMVRRHPHVFERNGDLDTPAAVLQQWDQIKKREKPQTSALDGVSPGLPSLPQAALLQERAARNGFAYPDAEAAWAKLQEELEEFRAQPSEAELGDVLFALVSLAHQHGLDPEAALRGTNRKFRQRYQGLERHFPEGLQARNPEELVSAWREIARQSP
ncbi:MAG: nucleoside triphosphate pyrophosphohydrolase [Candidatus Eremiobacteraeota bacterium]|nr:nucleoside triphosphate pyrophosphohydrolase [Candidatus Eremiobacteraeota bacterium]MCW5870827.1 nucleoside triphosphate pyrophosphohydrolase [Candidatus Eremiobacteraeota bacterium]